MIVELANEIRVSRVVLRRLKPNDAQDMFEYTSNHECTKFLSWSPHKDIAQTKSYIASVLNSNETSEHTWGIELNENQKFIGVVRLFNISPANKRAEISYIMNPVFQGKGLMVESITSVLKHVFNVGFNRIQARCTTENIASEKVMLKLGMSHEGVLQQYWYIKGHLKDATLYAITADNYKERLSKEKEVNGK